MQHALTLMTLFMFGLEIPDCTKLPEALRKSTPGCVATTGTISLEECIALTAQSDSLPPSCQQRFACYDTDLPTLPCLTTFPDIITYTDNCATFNETTLACILIEGTMAVIIAPGQSQPLPAPSNQQESQTTSARLEVLKGILRWKNKNPDVVDQAAQLRPPSTGQPQYILNRSYEHATPLMRKLEEDANLSPPPHYYFVNGTRVENTQGKPVIVADIPKHGDQCSITVTERFVKISNTDSNGKRLPKEERKANEQNRNRLALQVAALMGLPTCRVFQIE